MMEATKAETAEAVTLAEILPVARRLSAVNKLVLIRILAEDLSSNLKNISTIVPERTDVESGSLATRDPDVFSFPADHVFYLYTPYDSYGAAEQLAHVLEQIEPENSFDADKVLDTPSQSELDSLPWLPVVL
jgi:hypothetical protein